MKVIDPNTLQMREVPDDNKNYVYVLHDDSSWDYEQDSSIKIYGKFDDALEEFKRLVKNAKADYKDMYDDEIEYDREVQETHIIEKDKTHAFFEIFCEDDYDRFHDGIAIDKMEVM